MPTKGSPLMVARLLDSLTRSAKELPASVRYELIVVDDSEPLDRKAIEEACAANSARYLRGPRRVGAKRNHGVAHAKHELILFIDSDCVATPGLLRQHIDAHRTLSAPSGRPVAAVAGPTIVDDPDSAPAWRIVKQSVVVNAPWNWPLHFSEVWWAATSNLSVRRAAFEDVGGFDPETFTVVGGEDVDLGVRLHAAGYATVCSREAVVGHATDGITSLRQFQRKLLLYGRACVYNCTRQPEHARWSANPLTLLGIGLLAGLLPRGGRVAALATAATLAWFGRDVVRTFRRGHGSVGHAIAATSVDWCFHLGITAEALARRRPALAMKRFEYFEQDKFFTWPERGDDE
jgi:GT2 family glycosyltransferase